MERVLLLTAFLLFVAVWIFPFRAWLMARSAELDIGLKELVHMRLIRLDPRSIVSHAIVAREAGLEIPLTWLQAHALAGGRVDAVMNAMVAARREGRELRFEEAARLDLRRLTGTGDAGV